jgi:hypothetical protein
MFAAVRARKICRKEYQDQRRINHTLEEQLKPAPVYAKQSLDVS